MTVAINDGALTVLLNDPAGPIINYISGVVAVNVLEQARTYLSRPWPGGRGPFPHPGPPYERTGELKRSLEIAVVPFGPGGPEAVIIMPNAVHRGWNYGVVLRDGLRPMSGPYRFLPDNFYL